MAAPRKGMRAWMAKWQAIPARFQACCQRSGDAEKTLTSTSPAPPKRDLSAVVDSVEFASLNPQATSDLLDKTERNKRTSRLPG